MKALSAEDILLDKSQMAPWSGVLVSPERYRVFSIDHKEKTEILDKLDLKIGEVSCPETPDYSLMWFILGVASGSALVLMAR